MRLYASNLHKWFAARTAPDSCTAVVSCEELAPFEVRQPSTPDAPAMQRFGSCCRIPGRPFAHEAALDFHQSVGRDRLQGPFVSWRSTRDLRCSSLRIEFLTPIGRDCGEDPDDALSESPGCGSSKSRRRADHRPSGELAELEGDATAATLRTPPTRTTKSSDFSGSQALRARDSEEILWKLTYALIVGALSGVVSRSLTFRYGRSLRASSHEDSAVAHGIGSRMSSASCCTPRREQASAWRSG